MRDIHIAIVSDVHLGTYGSHAEEFSDYLKSINPEILILNGDIMDMWQFKKSYFPKSHFAALQAILDKIMSGVEVYYLTGNHDDALRKFSDAIIGNLHILDKLVLDLNGEKYWIFHGDVFDSSVQQSRWIAKIGGHAYDYLIRFNRFVNKVRGIFNRPPLSFSKKIKSNVKKAVKYISDFEQTAVDIAFQNDYDYVVCGHIHQPMIKDFIKDHQRVRYLNSGDWVEHLTALERVNGDWVLYDHYKHVLEQELVPIQEPEEVI